MKVSDTQSIQINLKTDARQGSNAAYQFGWNCVRCGRHFGQARDIMGHWCEEGLRAELQRRFQEAVEEDMMHSILYGLRR